MKILIDGETVAIFAHVAELSTITGLAQDGVKLRDVRNGGASQQAITITRSGPGPDRNVACPTSKRDIGARSARVALG